MRCEHLWAVYEAVSASISYPFSCAPVSGALAKEGAVSATWDSGQGLTQEKLNGNSRKTCIVCARLKRHGL